MRNRWWAGQTSERYWLEATDRDDIGADLRAPLIDAAGRDNWRYTLFREAPIGDVVFHYDGKVGAITGYSTITGAAMAQPIVWAARGSYARGRNATPQRLDGYAISLGGLRLLDQPVSLEAIRSAKSDLVSMVGKLRRNSGGASLYFPFELSDRPVRPMQGYAFKLPAAFVAHFGLDQAVGPHSDVALDTAENPEGLGILADLYAAYEGGGTYSVAAREAAGPQLVHKHQGEVWIRLAALLRERGISVEKPRHAAGYSVDAEIVNGDRKLLVEIKSSAAANDIHSAIGQLHLYRKLILRLENHVPVLLLPRLPHPVIGKAIMDCGIELCTFNLDFNGDEISIRFSDDFLRLCGLVGES